MEELKNIGKVVGLLIYFFLKESKRLRVYTLHNSKKAVTAD